MTRGVHIRMKLSEKRIVPRDHNNLLWGVQRKMKLMKNKP